METKKCLYEILGVERTATADEIRFAYRKLALKWHPDKIQQSGASPEECQEATIQFQEIGRAYEVLSDAAERSWYDSHRSQILSSSSSSSSDYDFNPWPYFSASVYSGYGDTGKGFYAVYGDLFTKIHQQEQAFGRSHGLRPLYNPPDMGGPNTDYSQVQKFYSHWLGFSTVKDFSWCDEYHASAGPNRKLRRLMEEENKKIRSKHRKEFNEAIRRLAAFVRKRDKRVLERQLEVQKREKEREEMLKQRRKKEEEEKRMKVRLYKEAEWTKVSPEEYDIDEGSDVDDSIGSYGWTSSAAKNSDNKSKKNTQDEFYCIVCSKKFKSDKQWKNHERSKKHLERVASLKESFMEEDEAMSLIETEIGRASQHNVESFISEIDDTKQGNAADAKESDVDDERDLRSGLVDSNLNESTADENDSGDEDLDTQDDEVQGLLSMIGAYKNRNREIEAEDSDDASHLLDKIMEEEKQNNSKNKQNEEEDEEEEEEGEEEENVGKDEDDKAEHFSSMLQNTKWKAQQPRKRNDDVKAEDEEDEEKEDRENEDEEAELLAAMLHNTKGKVRKQKKQNKEYHHDDDSETADHDTFSAFDSNTKSKKSRSKLLNEKKQTINNNRHSALVEEFFLAEEVDKLVDECSTLALKEENGELENHAVDENLSTNGAVENCKQIKNPGKNKLNSQLLAQMDQAKKPAKVKKGKGKAKNASTICETCGEDFESRNQLFKHISITKHAILKGK